MVGVIGLVTSCMFLLSFPAEVPPDTDSVAPPNRLEISVGREVRRESFAVIIGYSISAGSRWSFIPELNLLTGAQPSFSLRLEEPLSRAVGVAFQGGLGLDVQPYPVSVRGPFLLLSAGTMVALEGDTRLSIHSRVLVEAVDPNLAVGGTSSKVLNIRHVPPWAIAIGVNF